MNNYERAVNLYTSDMRRNGLSENSISSYSRTFRRFGEFMAENGFDEPSALAVTLFKDSLGDIALTSLSLYVQHLALLSQFGVKLGLFSVDFVPAEVQPSKKKVANERKKEYEHVLSEEDIISLLTADKPVYGRRSPTWKRESAIVALFIQSGLRNSELRALTLSDLNWQDGYIFARVTKGDKPRRVAFSDMAQKKVREYINSDCFGADSMDAPLFGTINKATNEWHELGREQLSTLVFHHTECILGKGNGVRTHALRHAYASVALSAHVDITELQETLGHSSPATTMIYAKRLVPEASAQKMGSIFDSLVSA